MSIVTISLPQGMYNNGTPYEAKSKWTFGNLIRWHDDALRPVGGWEQALDTAGGTVEPLTQTPVTETFRDGFSWVTNSNQRLYAFGSNKGVSLLDNDYIVRDITPTDFPQEYSNQPAFRSGYGSWLYGRSNYGTPRPQNRGLVTGYGTGYNNAWYYGVARPAADDPSKIGVWRWTFDTWGEDLIAGPGSPLFRGNLYYLDSSSETSILEPIPNAPTDVNTFVVTDQRIIMTIGSENEARLIRWSDREDYTDWTPTELNYAGDYLIQGNGDLVSIHRVLNQLLILGENDAHVARYIGAPLVYGFDRVGNGCGPLSAQTVAVTDRFAMWPGRRTFWMYDGTIKQVPCPLMDYFSADLDRFGYSLSHHCLIPQFNEIWWFYRPSEVDENLPYDDVSRYIAYDYVDGTWSRGTLSRSCAVSGEVYVDPVMVDTYDQYIFNHEKDAVIVEDAYAETGFLELGEGEQNLAVRYIYPDTETYGEVTYELLGSQFPTDAEYSYGPYDFANPISTRAMGRGIRMKVTGNSVGWKVGNKTRFDVAPAGTGRR